MSGGWSDELERGFCWEENTDELVSMLGDKTAENEKLRAENQELREALEAVEWRGSNVVYVCPYCESNQVKGHRENCKLGNALKLARGEK